jgi:hypothetical protein
MRRFVPWAVVLAASLTTRAAAESPCLRSGSGVVTVTGTLVQKIVPGPPNYQSVNHGDAAQLRWLIRLESSMCVTGASSAAAEAPEVSDVRVIQLVLPVATMDEHFDLVGTRVTATGFVSTQHVEHRPAVVLLDVTSIEATP